MFTQFFCNFSTNVIKDGLHIFAERTVLEESILINLFQKTKIEKSKSIALGLGCVKL